MTRESWVVEWRRQNWQPWSAGHGYPTRQKARDHAKRLRKLVRVRVVKYVPAQEQPE